MKVRLADIQDTEPRRDHGDIEGLKRSLQDLGLIAPIAVSPIGDGPPYRLLAGRRRVQAMSELGWPDTEAHIISTNGDQLLAFRIALHENLKRKPLTDPEVAIAIKEYDELKRQLEGEQPRGKHHSSLQCSDDGWTQDKTAADLGISRQAIGKAVGIATAIDEYPELINEPSGHHILREYKRKQREAEITANITPKEILPDDHELAPIECRDCVSEDGIHYKVFTRESKGCHEAWRELGPNDLELHTELAKKENWDLSNKLNFAASDINSIMNIFRKLRKYSPSEIKEAYQYNYWAYSKMYPLPYKRFRKGVAALTRELERFNKSMNDSEG